LEKKFWLTLLITFDELSVALTLFDLFELEFGIWDLGFGIR